MASGSTRWKVTAASGFALLAVGVAAWRVAPSPKDADITAERLRERGSEAYRQVDLIPLTALGSREEVRQAVTAVDFIDGELATANQRTILLGEAADFLYYRYAQSSVETYKAWRLGEGYRWRPLEVMLDPWYVDRGYKVYFDEEPPPELDLEAAFDRFWSAALDYGDGANRVVALPGEAKGLLCRFSRVTRAKPTAEPVGGEIPFELWYGGVAMTMRAWFEPPRAKSDVLAINGETLAAEIGLVLEFADGRRRPLFLTYYWDPAGRRWWLEHVNQNNDDWRKVSALEY
jgi:hypothetical protein